MRKRFNTVQKVLIVVWAISIGSFLLPSVFKEIVFNMSFGLMFLIFIVMLLLGY